MEVEDPSDTSITTTPLLLSSSRPRGGENNGCSSSSDHQPKARKWSAARWAIKLVIWLIFILWAALMFFFPLKAVKSLVEDWVSLTQNATPFASTGSVMLLFSGPILLIALLAMIYVALSHDQDHCYEQHPMKKGCNYSIWTFPVIVDGPLGVVSAAEATGALLFLTAVVFALVVYTADTVADVSSSQYPSVLIKWAMLLQQEGAHLGTLGILCLAFLFIPVARGSVLLRLIGIPFENATRYHVWLGHLTMLIFTLHGLSFALAWSLQGKLLQDLSSWGDDGIAVLPGVIALACGLILWATTLVRRTHFELFYYTHQLYIGFVIFLALHVSDYFFSIALGGILLFMFDRFLRFCQSRRAVHVISMTSHSCGAVELVLSKPPNVRYNAMSFIFINIRELSLLQWHPFSVSNSPIDGTNHISIIVKALGEWTINLHEQVSSIYRGNRDEPRNSGKVCQQEIPLTVSVEGPYGHESSYYLKYENLVLVAGGIGISPFLAILRDVLHRAKDGRSIFPRNISIIWAIKKSSELSLLLAVESINASLRDEINLEFQLYVTQQSEPDQLEESEMCNNITCFVSRNPKRTSLSPLVGTGDTKWSSIYISSSIAGFVLILGLVDACYVNRLGGSHTWFTGLLLLGCMAASVLVVGGLVALMWHLSSTKDLVSFEEQDSVDEHDDVAQQHSLVELSKMITYGCRPNFKEDIPIAILALKKAKLNPKNKYGMKQSLLAKHGEANTISLWGRRRRRRRHQRRLKVMRRNPLKILFQRIYGTMMMNRTTTITMRRRRLQVMRVWSKQPGCKRKNHV